MYHGTRPDILCGQERKQKAPRVECEKRSFVFFYKSHKGVEFGALFTCEQQCARDENQEDKVEIEKGNASSWHNYDFSSKFSFGLMAEGEPLMPLNSNAGNE